MTMMKNKSNDVQFSEYAEALKAGDLDKCAELRAHNLDNALITAKFRTLELAWVSHMSLYIREIQIVRRERDGYKNLAEGRQKKLSKDKTPPGGATMIRRGEKLLQQVEDAKAIHEEIELPSGFVGVKY